MKKHKRRFQSSSQILENRGQILLEERKTVRIGCGEQDGLGSGELALRSVWVPIRNVLSTVGDHKLRGGGGVVITIPLLSESLDLHCSPSFHSLKFLEDKDEGYPGPLLLHLNQEEK